MNVVIVAEYIESNFKRRGFMKRSVSFNVFFIVCICFLGTLHHAIWCQAYKEVTCPPNYLYYGQCCCCSLFPPTICICASSCPCSIGHCSLLGCRQLSQMMQGQPELNGERLAQIGSTFEHMESGLSTLSTDIENINTQLDNINTTASSINDNVDSINDLLSQDLPVLPIMITSAPYTISQSGVYALANTVYDTITINASNVVLDCNNNAIVSGSHGLYRGIAINPQCNNVVVKNGIIDSALGDCGIAVLSTELSTGEEVGCSSIIIENMVVDHCVKGIAVSVCDELIIRNCDFTYSDTGVYLHQCNNILVKNCLVQQSSCTALYIDDCTYGMFIKCKVVGVNSLGTSAYGFYIGSSDYIDIESCYFENILLTTSSSAATNVCAIYLANGNFLTINECVINGVNFNWQSCSSSSPSNCMACGIKCPTSGHYFISNNVISDIYGPHNHFAIDADNKNSNNVIIKNRAYNSGGYPSTIINQSLNYNPNLLDNVLLS